MRKVALLLFAMGLAGPLWADPITIEAPLPPVPAWHGASERLVARPGDPWITPAKSSGFETTPSYAETRAWIDRLVARVAAASASRASAGPPQGRELYAVCVAKPRRRPPKPVLLAQAGIHAGEIDGKDAGLMLLRDIALRGKDEPARRRQPGVRADLQRRRARAFVAASTAPTSAGPRSQGWRTTAQNLNLNRDYLKADTPEMQRDGRAHPHARSGALPRPARHRRHRLPVRHHLRLPGLATAATPSRRAIGRWLDRRFRPAMRRRADPCRPYSGPSDLRRRRPRPRTRASPDAAALPRFSDRLWRPAPHARPSCVENHSLKPYRQRVLGTYVLIEESLRLLASDGARPCARRSHTDRTNRPRSRSSCSWRKQRATGRRDRLPRASPTRLTTRRHRDGGEIRWLGRPMMQRMRVFGQEPVIRAATATGLVGAGERARGDRASADPRR